MTEKLKIRQATWADIAQIVAVEEKVWGNAGTEVYREEHFKTWLDVYPEGFLLAEKNGVITAFTYCFITHLTAAGISRLATFNDLTDNGFSRHVHDPNGNCHFGITICSVDRGSGHVLLQACVDFAYSRHKPLHGVSRIPGFSDYFNQAVVSGFRPEQEKQLALSYVWECVKMVNGCAAPTLPAKPELPNLPTLAEPDLILRKYLHNPHIVILAVLPNFLHDPQSRDFSILLRCKHP